MPGSSPSDPDRPVTRLRPVPPEPEPKPPGRGASELLTRVVTGVVMAALAVTVFSLGPAATVVLCAVIVGLATTELCGALRREGYRPAVLIALLATPGLVLAAYHSGPAAFPAVLGPAVVATLLWYLAGLGGGRAAAGMASTLGTFAYLGGLGGFAGLLLAAPHGVGLMIGPVLCVISYDICGYLVGSRFGSRRIAPRVSPNKTIEGLLAGMAGSVFAGVAFAGGIVPWGRMSGIALGVAVAVLAPLGDMCESMLKRDLGVKDLGGLLPGHGGVLDRFDAVLFALPGVYYLARLLGIA